MIKKATIYDTAMRWLLHHEELTEASILRSFLSNNEDRPEYMGDEGAIRALESDEFQEYILDRFMSEADNEWLSQTE